MASKGNTPKKAPLLEKTNRKLMIDPDKNKGRPLVRLIAEGKWDNAVQRVGKAGYAMFSLGTTHDIVATHYATLPEVIKACLKWLVSPGVSPSDQRDPQTSVHIC